MKRTLNLIKEESLKLLPCVLFFFIAFSLVDLIRIVTEKTYYNFLFLLGASLIMGKVVLISDLLPITKRYEHKPLIYNTLWKSLIYLACSFVVLITDRLIPAILEHKDLAMLWLKAEATIFEFKFWVTFIWLAALIINFVAYRELIHAIGPKKARKLFFGN